MGCDLGGVCCFESSDMCPSHQTGEDRRVQESTVQESTVLESTVQEGTYFAVFCQELFHASGLMVESGTPELHRQCTAVMRDDVWIRGGVSNGNIILSITFPPALLV